MSNAQNRFPVIQPEQMNTEQKKLFETITSGPRAQNYGGEAAKRVLSGGPFNAWMRSPEVGLKLQDVGGFIRFNSTTRSTSMSSRSWSRRANGPRNMSGTRTKRSP